MRRAGPKDDVPTWTPNQVVAANLARLRQRQGWTQAETARQLSQEEKAQRATYVVVNDGTVHELELKLSAVLDKLRP